jgi:hypothetical protein
VVIKAIEDGMRPDYIVHVMHDTCVDDESEIQADRIRDTTITNTVDCLQQALTLQYMDVSILDAYDIIQDTSKLLW